MRSLRHGETVKAHCNTVFKAMICATEKGGCLFIDLAGTTPVPNVGGSVYAMITVGNFSRFKVCLNTKNETTFTLRSFVVDYTRRAQDRRNVHRQWWGAP